MRIWLTPIASRLVTALVAISALVVFGCDAGSQEHPDDAEDGLGEDSGEGDGEPDDDVTGEDTGDDDGGLPDEDFAPDGEGTDDAGSGDELPDGDDAGEEDGPPDDGADAGDGDDGPACPEQQPHEKYCIEIGGYECFYEISFCRNGVWTCYTNQVHPPPMPEFEDWAWRCGVYTCMVPGITTEPPADWQDNPLDPYVPPDPASLTGEWIKLADLSNTIPIGCERQPRQQGIARSLVVSPSDPRIMFAGFAEGGGNVVGVWKSVDGGATWFEARAGLGSEGCYCFECSDPTQCEWASPGIWSLYIDPLDPDLVFASTWERGLYRTVDGGRYWTKVELPVPWPGICMIPYEFGPTGPVIRGPDGAYHAAACGSYHYVSYDLGETWEDWGQVSTGQYVNTWTFDPGNPNRVFAGMRRTPYPITGSGWVYLSEDGGRTWRKMGEDIEAFCLGDGFTLNLSVCEATPNLMATAILYCGLFISFDGGVNWVQASPPMEDDNPFWAAFSPSARECFLFAGRDWAPYGTFSSLDSGATWTEESASVALGWMFFNPYEPRVVVAMRSPFNLPPGARAFEVWARR